METKDKNFDAKLIKGYLKGDKKCLDVLIERYFRAVYSFLYSRVGSIADAEDLAQETFVKVWKNIRNFDAKKDFKPWVFQIAKNASIDFFRKRKDVPFSRFEGENGKNYLLAGLAGKNPDISRIIDDKKILAEAIQGISPDDKKIMSLHKQDSLTFREISELLNMPVNTIKSRYRRAVISAKKFFQS
jgi:RNA polymerase sigma-70 factor (ECF subfamily)